MQMAFPVSAKQIESCLSMGEGEQGGINIPSESPPSDDRSKCTDGGGLSAFMEIVNEQMSCRQGLPTQCEPGTDGLILTTKADVNKAEETLTCRSKADLTAVRWTGHAVIKDAFLVMDQPESAYVKTAGNSQGYCEVHEGNSLNSEKDSFQQFNMPRFKAEAFLTQVGAASQALTADPQVAGCESKEATHTLDEYSSAKEAVPRSGSLFFAEETAVKAGERAGGHQVLDKGREGLPPDPFVMPGKKTPIQIPPVRELNSKASVVSPECSSANMIRDGGNEKIPLNLSPDATEKGLLNQETVIRGVKERSSNLSPDATGKGLSNLETVVGGAKESRGKRAANQAHIGVSVQKVTPGGECEGAKEVTRSTARDPAGFTNPNLGHQNIDHLVGGPKVPPGDFLGNDIQKVEPDGIDNGRDSWIALLRSRFSERTAQALNSSREVNSLEKYDKSEVLSQIVERAVLSMKGEQREIRINLKPEFLGHLHLKISTDNNQIAIRILTEIPLVREMIESNVGQLKTDLQNQGLEVDKFDVFVSRDSDAYDEEHGEERFADAGGERKEEDVEALLCEEQTETLWNGNDVTGLSHISCFV